MRVAKYFLIIIVVAACLNTMGETLAVPGDYPAIQAAIDAARPGDVVEVGPGIYEENLTIRQDIELKGTGPDSTIVRNASKNGAILKIIDTANSRISGFKFEHSDTASLPTQRTVFPDAVNISNSNAEIHNCTTGPSAGCGIAIVEKSICSIVECHAERNSQAGILVKGEGTTATLVRNKCTQNQYSGIALIKGSKVEAIDNICLNNERWGIRVLDKGSSIVLKNNTFSFNRGPGISIEYWAHATVEGNICRENNGNGILFKLGADGSASGNTLEKNAGQGISIQSLGVNIELHDNICNANQGDGISAYLGANGNIVGNTCTNNGWSGIAIGGWFTNALVKENECSENSGHGVFFERGATGRIEANVCRGNKLNGILTADEKTNPDIGSNLCENNIGEDIARIDRTPVFLQNQINSEEMGCALANERFDEIEKIADLLRQHKCRYCTGGWQLDSFYDGLQAGCGDLSPKNRDAFTALLERWKKAYPESMTPLITQAKVHATYGWDARGSGYASTVTDEGWKIFHKELGIAQGDLREAEALKGNDPYLYNVMLNVWNGLNASSRETQDIFNKGIAIDNGYFPLYYTNACFLLPRWGARSGELERFAEQSFENTRKEYGFTLYAAIAGAIASCIGSEDFINDHSFDWEKVNNGYIELLEAFPESNYYVNQYCLMACLNHDQEKAKELFDRIGRDIDDSVWRGRSEFHKWKQWTLGMAKAPYQKPSPGILDMSTQLSKINALQTNAKALLERISWTETAMALATVFVGAVFLLYSSIKRRRTKTMPKPHPDQENSTEDRTTL